MDPNLEKFQAVAVEDLSRGRLNQGQAFARAMSHAEHYLATVLGEESSRIWNELQSFKRYLKEGFNGLKRQEA